MVLKAVHIYHSLRIVSSYIVDSYVLIFTMHDSLIGELETSCYEVRKAELVLYIVYPFFKRLTPEDFKNVFFGQFSILSI